MSNPMTDELVRFLVEILPEGWADAAEAGDDGVLRPLRRRLDVRAVIARLGAAWVGCTALAGRARRTWSR